MRVTAFNQIHAADPYQPGGLCAVAAGAEDPSILPLLGRPYNAPAPASLQHIPDQSTMSISTAKAKSCGSKPIRSPGVRTLRPSTSDTGDIVDETYASLPTSYVIRQRRRRCPRSWR